MEKPRAQMCRPLLEQQPQECTPFPKDSLQHRGPGNLAEHTHSGNATFTETAVQWEKQAFDAWLLLSGKTAKGGPRRAGEAKVVFQEAGDRVPSAAPHSQPHLSPAAGHMGIRPWTGLHRGAGKHQRRGAQLCTHNPCGAHEGATGRTLPGGLRGLWSRG